MNNVKKSIRVRVRYAGEAISARCGQTASKLDIPYSPRLFSNANQLHAGSQAHHYNNPQLRVIFLRAIEIYSTNPQAANRLLGSKRRGQLGERVKGQRIVADDARLVDLGKYEYLLHAGARILCIAWLES